MHVQLLTNATGEMTVWVVSRILPRLTLLSRY